MPAIIEVKYFNSFILRKTVSSSGAPVWNGCNGTQYPIGSSPTPADPASGKNWSIEEARIRGGYNNTTAGYGVKAYLVEEEPNSSNRINSMIYSGIFNSRTGINNTNVFSVGEDIVKSVDPANGSIQKLYAEDTNLIVFQENKVSRALIDKDAIYSAEGNATVTTGPNVIGQVQAFGGEYGISRNPESFAVYGYRKYFTDKDRNAVLRLSNDGITEISNYGMSDYFRDNLSTLDNNQGLTGKAQGMWDIYNKNYTLSLQPAGSDSYGTLSFDEGPKGWTSFYSYKPTMGTSLKNNFYTFHNGAIYRHYDASVKRNEFYGVVKDSSVKFVFNPNVSMSKVFKTINYEGSNGWEVNSFESDFTGIGSPITRASNTQDSTTLVYSYNQGSYDNYGNEYPATLIPPINYAGFVRKENKYTANLINNSPAAAGEISWGAAMTGIKGYFATVTVSTDNVTDYGGAKELFAVSSDYVESSY